MGVDSRITDGATGQTAGVGKYGQVTTAMVPPDVPARGVVNRLTAYNALIGSSGAVETGIVGANMNLDGSVTPLEFFIKADPDVDIRIMRVVFTIADSAIVHSAFGNVAALTNGFTLHVMERGTVTNLVNAVKTGGEAIIQAGMFAPYGDGATSFEMTNITGTTDAQAFAMDIGMVVPGGIRLARGTEDLICGTVADDLTGLSEFTVRVMGYRHHE